MGRAAVSVILLTLVACAQAGPSAPSPDAPPEADGASPIPAGEGFAITTPAFQDGDPIPEVHTCNGENVSPPLEWSGVPEGTVELVLVLQDPDAPGGNFFHWTAFGIDPSVTGSSQGGTPDGALEGTTNFGETGYGGPCPPPGESHLYVFELAALQDPSGLESGADPAAVFDAVQAAGDTTRLTGRYEPA